MLTIGRAAYAAITIPLFAGALVGCGIYPLLTDIFCFVPDMPEILDDIDEDVENTGLIEGLTKKSARYDRIAQLSANHRLAYANSRLERFRVAYKELLDNPTLTIEQKRGAWRQIIESPEVKCDLKQIDTLLDGVKVQKHHIIHQKIWADIERAFPGSLVGFNVNDPVNFVYLPEDAKIAKRMRTSNHLGGHSRKAVDRVTNDVNKVFKQAESFGAVAEDGLLQTIMDEGKGLLEGARSLY